MTTREKIAEEIAEVPDEQLGELYQIIKNFETGKVGSQSQEGLMSRLRKIRISATPDFSMTAGLYDSSNRNGK